MSSDFKKIVKIKMVDFMTEESKQVVLKLNLIDCSSHIQIVDRRNDLLLAGFLKIVEPKNKTQAKLCGEKECIVQLSNKGSELLLKALS